MQDMVRLESLAKRFGPVHAVEHVTLSVARGEVLGFLGPNGAGKTTTMRMIAGFILPSSGSASIMGHDVVKQPLKTKRRIGYLPEGAPSYGDMSVLAFLRFIASMRGYSGSECGRRVEAAMDRTSLHEVCHRPIETLSKGFKRRVGLAQAIIHDPPVLVMDEPTDGLDPNQKHDVRQLIESMAVDKAIIVSTHILEEVEAVCSRAVIIAKGRVVADETPEALKRRSSAHNALRIGVASAQAPKLVALLEGIDPIKEVQSLEEADGIAMIRALPRNGAAILEPVNASLRASGLAVSELSVEQGRLDEVFRQLTTTQAS